jgi:hypothetical protein
METLLSFVVGVSLSMSDAAAAPEPIPAAPADPAVNAPVAAPAAPQGAAPFRLMSPEREQVYRGFLPRVEDEEVAALLADPRLILYTEEEMPPAYQSWDGELQGIHSPQYNISANGSEPFGNGNREFPWDTPAGTHRARGITSVRFFRLPQDEAGRTLPVAWYRRVLPGDGTLGYAWIFPVGTVFGEALALTGPDGYGYTFELRLRYRETGDWAVDVLRPFPSAAELAERIVELRPDWEQRPTLAAAVGRLRGPVEMKYHLIADSQPGRRTFEQWAGLDELPDLGDDDLVRELLTTTPFRSAVGKVWREEGGVPAFAATTKAPFHIVPADYDGGFVAADNVSCLRCHETTNRHVREFNPGRDWYGRVRGSDGIFTFHPFDPGSISYNGYGQGVAMRSEMVEAGVLQRYDPALHPADRYSVIPELVH